MNAAIAPRRIVLAFLLGLVAVFALVWINSLITGGTGKSGSISTGDDELPVGIDVESFSISGSLEAPLKPGLSSGLDVKVKNPSDRELSIRDLAVKVTSITAPYATAELPCTVADFTTTTATGDIVLAATTTKTLSDLGLTERQWPQVSMLNTKLNQDGCKNATLSLTYTGTGDQK